jgi:hypothetical protein
MTKFKQRLLKQEIGKFALRLRNFFILFGVRKNCQRSVPVYKKVIRQIFVILETYQFFQIHKNFIQHPALKVNSIGKLN